MISEMINDMIHSEISDERQAENIGDKFECIYLAL